MPPLHGPTLLPLLRKRLEERHERLAGGFVAVVEGGKDVAFVHVDKEEELLPEDSGSLAPLASPASADAELASLPMLTLTFSVAE